MAQESERSANPPTSGVERDARAGFGPLDPTSRYDSNLRLALALIDAKDWGPLATRTGIDCFNPENQFMSLFVEFHPDKIEEKDTKLFDMGMLLHFELLAPLAYGKEHAINPKLRTIAVRIELRAGDPSRTVKGTLLTELLEDISNSGVFRRLRIAVPHGNCLERSLAAIDLPPGNVYNYKHLTGKDIVIGVIDDGCAFAHPDFLQIRNSGKTRSYHTRVLALWDQSQSATAADTAVGWNDIPDYGYGRELPKAAIDLALARHSSKHKVNEDDVYEELNYEVGLPGDCATHGTEVMGIAAGNGNSLMGWHGVAPRADIIFVQLPPAAVHHTPKLLSDNIVHGVQYIFQRARDLNKKAAVVNISYGGYSGPHDGTSAWETALDELLQVTDRSVVVSAGNGFEADCHAMATLQPGQESRLRWILKAGDPTANDLEIWYNGDAALNIWLTPPVGSQELGPFAFCAKTDLVLTSSGIVVGSIEHVQQDPNNGDNSAAIALLPTAADPLDTTNPLSFAPAGMWVVRLRNIGSGAAQFHGWIHRDDIGKPGGARQQSRFVPEDAYPGYTIGDFATGKLTISAGAFNAKTDEVCAYSACGPTRASTFSGYDAKGAPLPNPARQQPAICAPAEELATGGGVLTTSSRRAPPRRLNGTSAAAPHVAGIVALAFDLRRNYQKKHLTAAELRAALSGQTGGNPLAPDRRQESDDSYQVKQRDVWADLIGAGKISCVKTLDNL